MKILETLICDRNLKRNGRVIFFWILIRYQKCVMEKFVPCVWQLVQKIKSDDLKKFRKKIFEKRQWLLAGIYGPILIGPGPYVQLIRAWGPKEKNWKAVPARMVRKSLTNGSFILADRKLKFQNRRELANLIIIGTVCHHFWVNNWYKNIKIARFWCQTREKWPSNGLYS